MTSLTKLMLESKCDFEEFPKLVATFLINVVAPICDSEHVAIDTVPSNELRNLIMYIFSGEITNGFAKECYKEMLKENKSAIEVVESKLRDMLTDDQLNTIINNVLIAETEAVNKYNSGNTKILGYLVGKVTKETKGKADAKKVNEILTNSLLNKKFERFFISDSSDIGFKVGLKDLAGNIIIEPKYTWIGDIALNYFKCWDSTGRKGIYVALDGTEILPSEYFMMNFKYF